MSLLPKVFPLSDNQRQQKIESDLLRMEAKIGGALFGKLPKGHQRQFFCLDEYTWIWHESWKDGNGKQRTVTTRYEVRQDGILKSQDGQTRQRLSKAETRNFYQATELYRQRVGAEYGRMLQAA